MDIGLHFYVSHIKEGDNKVLKKEFEFQKQCLCECLGGDFECFSYHRPPSWVLKDRSNMFHGKINAYGEAFFESSYSKTIKYIADTQHRFKYGSPLDKQILDSFVKFQIYSSDECSQHDPSASENFRNLELESLTIFKNTLSNECNHYTEEI